MSLEEHEWSSEAETHGIRVRVRAFFVPERSTAQQFFFAYRILVSNEGEVPLRLESRYWRIVDGNGQEREVRGPGVVGQQPRIEPGEHFQYTSFCPLETPVGSMEGTFRMVNDDGRAFEAEVATFTLAAPNALN